MNNSEKGTFNTWTHALNLHNGETVLFQILFYEEHVLYRICSIGGKIHKIYNSNNCLKSDIYENDLASILFLTCFSSFQKRERNNKKSVYAEKNFKMKNKKCVHILLLFFFAIKKWTLQIFIVFRLQKLKLMINNIH